MRLRYLVCILALGAPAGAQPLPVLVEEALRSNREILAAQKRYEAARQRPSQARSLPDPTVSVGYTSNGGPWPVAGIGHEATSNAGLTVSQEMPFPGKRKLRGEIAGKDADAEFEQYLAVRLNVVSRLKQAYHELHHATVGIAFVKRYQDVLRNILRISEARYAVGRAAQQDVFKAQTQFSIFETQLLRYEQERDSKQIEIGALLNRPGAGRIEVPEDVPLGELKVTLEEMLAHARTQAPALEREQKMVERSELAANLARKSYYPDYTVSGGYFNQGGLPPLWKAQVDFKLPAYFWRKQRAEVTGQEASASQARHEYAATLVEVEAEIREQYSTAEASLKLVNLYEKTVIPEARLAYESALASYQAGRGDFIAPFTSFISVVDYTLTDHEEIVQSRIALAKLEELTGVETR